jgi:hypothetical protein
MTEQVCQSCGMPMHSISDYGTNEDKSENTEYCCYCFQVGSFTKPRMTMEEMIDRVAGMMSIKTRMPLPQAKTIAKTMIPKLKRWHR